MGESTSKSPVDMDADQGSIFGCRLIPYTFLVRATVSRCAAHFEANFAGRQARQLELGRQAGYSIRRPPRSRVDLDRRRHASDQANAIRYLINPDVHRHTLSKPYPSEDWVHRRKPLLVRLR